MKFQLERIALFSDAVFAIAITLMMIELKPPHLEHGISFSGALEAFSKLMPMLLGVFLSFFLIGSFWKQHHELMKYMAAYDSKVIALNLGLLLSIAFIPFSTAFLSENIESHSPFTWLIYNLNYMCASFLNYKLFMHILNPANNLKSETAVQDMETLKKDLLLPIAVYGLVIILAFITPDFAGLGYAAFALENIWSRKRKKELARANPQTVPSETGKD